MFEKDISYDEHRTINFTTFEIGAPLWGKSKPGLLGQDLYIGV